MATEEFCFLGITHWLTCLSKAEWAAWTQAVFSVLAIAAATGIAARQNRHAVQLQAALRREDGLRQLDITIALADRAVFLLETTSDSDATDAEVVKFWARFSRRDYELAAVDLRKIGPEHVPSGTVLTQVTSLARLLDDAAVILGDTDVRNREFRDSRREYWNAKVRPFFAMRELATGNRAVLRSIRENV